MGKQEYPIPDGYRATPCKGCGEEIYWIKTKTGNNMPLNPDGSSHFASCPKADTFRRKEDPTQKHLFDEVLWWSGTMKENSPISCADNMGSVSSPRQKRIGPIRQRSYTTGSREANKRFWCSRCLSIACGICMPWTMTGIRCGLASGRSDGKKRNGGKHFFSGTRWLLCLWTWRIEMIKEMIAVELMRLDLFLHWWWVWLLIIVFVVSMLWILGRKKWEGPSANDTAPGESARKTTRLWGRSTTISRGNSARGVNREPGIT